MPITKHAIDQAFAELHGRCGGVRGDYFGLLYLEEEFGLDRSRVLTQVDFGGNDTGINGFHFDPDRRNLYLFHFRFTDSHAPFKQAFTRLIHSGMERIFGDAAGAPTRNQLLQQLQSCLAENESLIDRVCLYFVFAGDPTDAERSQMLDKLREDLENKKYLIDQRLGRPATMVIEFRSARTRKVGSTSHLRKTHTYPVTLEETVTRQGPGGEVMTIGFIRLQDLHAMHRDMGQRFFERNIRAALPEDKAVNRSIQASLKRIVVDGKEDPQVFGFNHNGVTLYAEALVAADGQFQLTEPRLLNGAQTVMTFARFVQAHEGHAALNGRRKAVAGLQVMCRIITHAMPEFVTTVTINNNRQNPVEPWNLHANDAIQLELQDKFRDDLGLYYERQERAFENISDEDLEEQGIVGHKAIELTRLARTFLASDGELDKLSRFRDVFEDDRIYAQVFGPGRLRTDLRRVVVCYKVQFRLRKLIGDIVERGTNKYAYVQRGRNMLWALLCQAALNDPDIDARAEEFGRGLALEAQFTEWLSGLATARCRFLLSDLVEDKAYAAKAAEGNFSFLRTNAAYKRSMEFARKRWKWDVKRLTR